MRSDFQNLTGQKFGKLTIINVDPIKVNNRHKWIYQCDCGKTVSVRSQSLKDGTSKSCGCYNIEIATKHGDRHTRIYQIWCGLKGRCSNQNIKSHSHYGGRGITVCNRWLKYENFKEDMYDSYILHCNQFGEKDTTIERIDNDGNYELSNCKWATHLEQINNRRMQRLVEAEYILPGESFGYKETMINQSQFAKKYGLTRHSIQKCLSGHITMYKGWIFKYLD